MSVAVPMLLIAVLAFLLCWLVSLVAKVEKRVKELEEKKGDPTPLAEKPKEIPDLPDEGWRNRVGVGVPCLEIINALIDKKIYGEVRMNRVNFHHLCEESGRLLDCFASVTPEEGIWDFHWMSREEAAWVNQEAIRILRMRAREDAAERREKSRAASIKEFCKPGKI